MTKFADDCRCQMRAELHNLTASLGPKVLDLALRIGLHSGPVTVSNTVAFLPHLRHAVLVSHRIICRTTPYVFIATYLYLQAGVLRGSSKLSTQGFLVPCPSCPSVASDPYSHTPFIASLISY